MAISGNACWEVRTAGSDSSGGGFATGGNTYGITNLAGSNCRSSAPTVSTGSYTFVNGDNTHWLYITGGTFITGLYQILSQSGGVATLAPFSFTGNLTNGSPIITGVSSFVGLYVGMAVNGTGITAGTTILAASPRSGTVTLSANATATNTGVTVTQNVGTVDSPSGGSATIDRTQNNSAFTNGTNLTVDASTNTKVNPDGYTVTTADVGNVIHITTTGTGAAFTVGFYQIIAVTTGGSQRWTLDRSPAAVNSAGATWAMGGALATLGTSGLTAASAMQAQNRAFVKAGSGYSITAGFTLPTDANPPAQTVPTQYLIGYTSVRGDGGVVTVTLSTNTGVTMLTTGAGTIVENFLFDCNTLGTSTGINTASATVLRNCAVRNFTANGIRVGGNNIWFINCEVYGGTAAGTACYNAAAANWLMYGCVARDSLCHGFQNNGGIGVIANCLFVNLTGASTDGVNIQTAPNLLISNTFFNIGRHGVNGGSSTAGGIGLLMKDNLFHSCGANGTGYGFVGGTAAGQAPQPTTDGNAYYNNATGNRNFADDVGAISTINSFWPWLDGQDIILTADPLAKASTSHSDLVVDASNNQKVTAVSHSFVGGDVGSTIYIASYTGGWTRGEYTITSVASGAAVLDRSPAAVTTSGGVWYFDGYALNNVAGGGAALRGFSSIYQIAPYTAGAVNNEDIGGVQHLDSSSFAVNTVGTYSIRAATATAGGASTITLDAGATSTTDIYKGLMITIIAGTGLGQSRFIKSNTNASPPVVTVAPAWATVPDTTSVFNITPWCGTDVESWAGDSAGISVDTNHLPVVGVSDIQGTAIAGTFLKNTAFNNFEFVMIQSSDHVTPLAGLGGTITSTVSIDGAALTATVNAASEVGSGIYKINLTAADLNGKVCTFLFTGSGADPQLLTIITT